MNDIEKRLKALEDELKAMKASYATAGSAARLYVTEINATIEAAPILEPAIPVDFRFTPIYRGLSNNMIVSVSAKSDYAFVSSGLEVYALPQNGNGTATIRVRNLYTIPLSFKIVVSSTSPGTIVRI